MRLTTHLSSRRCCQHTLTMLQAMPEDAVRLLVQPLLSTLLSDLDEDRQQVSRVSGCLWACQLPFITTHSCTLALEQLHETLHSAHRLRSPC